MIKYRLLLPVLCILFLLSGCDREDLYSTVKNFKDLEIVVINNTDIHIIFYTEIDQTSAETLTNYTIVPAPGSPIALKIGSRTIEYSATFSAATNHTVTVENVRDSTGSIIPKLTGYFRSL